MQVRGGMLVMAAGGLPGTIGMLVRRAAAPEVPHVLTSWHVIAGTLEQRGKPVRSPPRGVIGYLADWVRDWNGDAAVARLLPIPWSRSLACGGDGHIRPPRAPRLHEILYKCGARTGKTSARIVDLRWHRLATTNKLARAIFLRPWDGGPGEISLPGDSGAIWYGQDGAAVGIHTAGETSPDPNKELAVACAAEPAFRALKVQPW